MGPQPKENLSSKNEAMQRVIADARLFATHDHPILILGETGTGKEVLADYIHAHSLRAKLPIYKINCAAIPEALFESELFGHEKGSFTGAHMQRRGRFELANGATLLLDEIGELSLTMQSKLLRVLQDGSFNRVGGVEELRSDVRLLLTTNRDLSDERLFRRDLYYRLSSFTLRLPPLRDRIEDLPSLVASMGAVVDHEGLAFLMRLCWDGNVRELRGAIDRARHGKASELSLSDFAFLVKPEGLESRGFDDLNLENIERRAILSALEKAFYVQSEASKLLGITPRALNYKIRHHGIRHATWRSNGLLSS